MQIEREIRQAEEDEKLQEEINMKKIKFLEAAGLDSDDELLDQID